MSAQKSDIQFNEEEKVDINKGKNNSQIIRYSKDFIKNLRFEKIKQENNKQNEYIIKENNSKDQNDIDKIKQKLKENLDSNLNSYILSTKAKEQKILELLEIINQYESQITSLNNQIMILTKSNKQMKDIFKKIEYNYEQNKMSLISEREINKNNNKQMNNLYQDKIICEKKIEELVNIINQYSGQIEALTETLNNIKNEFFNYKKQNEQDKNKIIELNNINQILQKEKEQLDENYNKLKEDFEKLKQGNEKLNIKCFDLENKNKILNEQKEKDEGLLEKEKNKSIYLIDYINQDLQSLINYFDNKFNAILNKENNDIFQDNKLTLNCFQNIENNDDIKKINFEALIKAIINGINSIKEKNDKENKKISNTKNNLITEKKYLNIKNEIKIKEAQIENMNKIIKMKDDNINKLKDDIKKLVEDNIKLIKELEVKYI